MSFTLSSASGTDGVCGSGHEFEFFFPGGFLPVGVSAGEGEGGSIDRYNDWQTTALDRDITPDLLKKLILCPDWDSTLVGADRVDITKPVFTEIGKSGVAKFSGSLTVTHEVTS